MSDGGGVALAQVREGLTRGPHLHYDHTHWISLDYVLDLLDKASDNPTPTADVDERAGGDDE